MIKYFKFIVLATLIVSCTKSKTNEVKQTSPAKVETFALSKGKIATDVSLPGELFGFKEVELFGKVSSYVKALNVDIGTKVKAGQLLIQLEAPEIGSQLAAAKSEMLSSQATFTASNATYSRMFSTSKVEGTISKNALDQSKAQRDVAQSNYESAKSRYKELQVMQGYLSIRAPFDGVITARNVNLGAYVDAGVQVPLLSISEQNKFRVVVSIPEAYTGYIKLGDNLTFTVNSLPGQEFKAPISRRAGALDMRLRAERIELDVLNSKQNLMSGMIASVLLPLSSQSINGFTIPKSALMDTSEGLFIIRVKDKKANWVAVTTGLRNNETIEIFSTELSEGDSIITKAAEEIRRDSNIDL